MTVEMLVSNCLVGVCSVHARLYTPLKSPLGAVTVALKWPIDDGRTGDESPSDCMLSNDACAAVDGDGVM